MNKKQRLNASALQSHIGYRLRVVSNAVSQSFSKRLAACDVTVAEWVVLREMYSCDGGTSPSAVANLTGLTRGAVSKLIERLMNKHLVKRTQSALDRRFQNIYLTAKAIQKVPRLASLADENDAHFFAVLSAEERKNLQTLLIKIAEHHALSAHPVE